MNRVIHPLLKSHVSAWLSSYKTISTILDSSCRIFETLLNSKFSLVIDLGVGDVTSSPPVIFDRLKVTDLKYLEDLFCHFIFNAGARSFVTPSLVDHLFVLLQNFFS